MLSRHLHTDTSSACASIEKCREKAELISLAHKLEGIYDVIVAKPGHKIKIPLSESEALAGLLAVKPTAGMPRPGANPTGKKKIQRRRKAAKKED